MIFHPGLGGKLRRHPKVATEEINRGPFETFGLMDGKTYVLSGHHRLAAAKQAGREKVKVIDRSKDFTEEQAIRFARKKPTPTEQWKLPLKGQIRLGKSVNVATQKMLPKRKT